MLCRLYGLKRVHKDFSQARVSYFLQLHFPNYSSTTFAGWLWNIVTVKEWHFSAGVVQIALKWVHKDFFQAWFSYFSSSHFPNYSLTTGWLQNIVSVKFVVINARKVDIQCGKSSEQLLLACFMVELLCSEINRWKNGVIIQQQSIYRVVFLTGPPLKIISFSR